MPFRHPALCSHCWSRNGCRRDTILSLASRAIALFLHRTWGAVGVRQIKMLHRGRFGSCLPIHHAHLRLAWLAHVPNVFRQVQAVFRRPLSDAKQLYGPLRENCVGVSDPGCHSPRHWHLNCISLPSPCGHARGVFSFRGRTVTPPSSGPDSSSPGPILFPCR